MWRRWCPGPQRRHSQRPHLQKLFSSTTQGFRFEVLHESKKSKARAGILHTKSGPVHTPAFVAVGTNGTLKYVDNADAARAGLSLCFMNTYHLLIHPGPEIMGNAGGLHKFTGRSGPIITDSGGFQVFSLAYASERQDELKGKAPKQYENSVLKISEEGVTFRSYRDGKRINLTPESTVEFQKVLDSDIIIPLDELLPNSCSPERLLSSFERTHRWEKRSLDTHLKNIKGQAMYAVVHGGTDPVLRERSARELSQHPFDGFAIGGSLGRNKREMMDVLAATVPHLREESPIHLLGIGDPDSVDGIVKQGVDTMDSCYPTRAGRHGTLFTSRDQGIVRVTQGKYADLHEPVDPMCTCPCCSQYTCSYIHHLFKMHEPVAQSLGALHNLYFMISKMEGIRSCILEGRI